MNKSKNAHCRLCAESKPSSKLTDLETEKATCSEIVNKLLRLNCQLNFNEDNLPKTVCIMCKISLNRAFAFIVAVENAQTMLKEAFLPQIIKKEIEYSDNDNCEDEIVEEKIDVHYNQFNDNTIIKTEKEFEQKSSKPGFMNKFDNSPKRTKKERNELYVSVSPMISEILTWKDYTWKCKVCETQFPEVSELISHSITYHKTCNAYSCTDCSLKTLTLDKFLTHIRKHRNYLKYSCYKCNMEFTTMGDLFKHNSAHIESSFKCNGCNSYFPSLDELKKHMSTFYKQPWATKPPPRHQDSLTCLKCKKKYKSLATLDKHLLIHTDRTRDHICEVCGKCFLHKQHLAGHLLIHDDNRPHQCKICKYSFKTKANLLRHVDVHDTVKSFACELCGKCFRLQKQLKSHSIVHTDSLPYVCTYCNKAFRFKTILNQHIRQHTGIKPYSCDICQKEFTNWPNYNKHMKCRHSKDMSKKKHTPNGLYPVDPATGQVVYPEMDIMLEWKHKILKEKIPHKRKLKNKESHKIYKGN